MVKQNFDGTFTFKNGVTAKLVNGKYKLINKQMGGRVSMPSEYFGNITNLYSSQNTNNNNIDINNEIPSGDLAREAIPSTFNGGDKFDSDIYSGSSFDSNFDEPDKINNAVASQQTGGDNLSKLNYIFDKKTNKKYNLFSEKGKQLLKSYVNQFKKN